MGIPGGEVSESPFSPPAVRHPSETATVGSAELVSGTVVAEGCGVRRGYIAGTPLIVVASGINAIEIEVVDTERIAVHHVPQVVGGEETQVVKLPILLLHTPVGTDNEGERFILAVLKGTTRLGDVIGNVGPILIVGGLAVPVLKEKAVGIAHVITSGNAVAVQVVGIPRQRATIVKYKKHAAARSVEAVHQRHVCIPHGLTTSRTTIAIHYKNLVMCRVVQQEMAQLLRRNGCMVGILGRGLAQQSV